MFLNFFKKDKPILDGNLEYSVLLDKALVLVKKIPDSNVNKERFKRRLTTEFSKYKSLNEVPLKLMHGKLQNLHNKMIRMASRK